MDRKQWLAVRGNGGSLRKFYRGRERFIHVSAEAAMVSRENADGTVSLIPWVQKPGVTYRKG